jgi:hypothetical protein
MIVEFARAKCFPRFLLDVACSCKTNVLVTVFVTLKKKKIAQSDFINEPPVFYFPSAYYYIPVNCHSKADISGYFIFGLPTVTIKAP